jgi:hypothetical protein
MKLFHGAPALAVDEIIENGLEARGQWKVQAEKRLIESAVVFGFDNAEDAESFAIDQCFDGGYAVFSFEAEEGEVMIDPEYDGNAYAALDARFVEIVIDARH